MRQALVRGNILGLIEFLFGFDIGVSHSEKVTPVHVPERTSFRRQTGFVNAFSDKFECLPDLSLGPKALSLDEQELLILVSIWRCSFHANFSSFHGAIQIARAKKRTCSLRSDHWRKQRPDLGLIRPDVRRHSKLVKGRTFRFPVRRPVPAIPLPGIPVPGASW